MPIAAIAPAVAALIGGGAAAGASVYGAKRAGASADRSARYTADADRMAMEEARAQREEDARRWAAEQEFQRQQWAAQEEERAYGRRLQEEREARQAPYRQASQAALGNLGQMLGINLGNSPLGQSVSAPRSQPPMPAQNTGAPMGWGQPPAAWMPPTQQPSGPMPMTAAKGPTPIVGTVGDMTGLKRRTGVRY